MDITEIKVALFNHTVTVAENDAVPHLFDRNSSPVGFLLLLEVMQ